MKTAPSDPDSRPDDSQDLPRSRRRYRKPSVISETTFEIKAMACPKNGTGNPVTSCTQNFTGFGS